MAASLDGGVSRTIFGTLALTSDLFSIIIVLGATVKFLIKRDFFHLL